MAMQFYGKALKNENLISTLTLGRWIKIITRSAPGTFTI